MSNTSLSLFDRDFDNMCQFVLNRSDLSKMDVVNYTIQSCQQVKYLFRMIWEAGRRGGMEFARKYDTKVVSTT